MQYDESRFLALLVRVEEQGGRLLDSAHETRYDSTPILKAYEPTGRNMRVRVVGCGEQALFEIPYESRVGSMVACAVCDNLGAWPRFS